MKSLRQKLLAAKIEYHWWRIDKLKKSRENKTNHCETEAENLHRYKAEQLAIEYEISLGLRDRKGKIIA